MARWSKAEVAVVVSFKSHGASVETIVEVLNVKRLTDITRTINQVRSKIKHVLERDKGLRKPESKDPEVLQRWLDRVDEFLRRLIPEAADLMPLIYIGDKEIKAVTKHGDLDSMVNSNGIQRKNRSLSGLNCALQRRSQYGASHPQSRPRRFSSPEVTIDRNVGDPSPQPILLQSSGQPPENVTSPYSTSCPRVGRRRRSLPHSTIQRPNSIGPGSAAPSTSQVSGVAPSSASSPAFMNVRNAPSDVNDLCRHQHGIVRAFSPRVPDAIASNEGLQEPDNPKEAKHRRDNKRQRGLAQPTRLKLEPKLSARTSPIENLNEPQEDTYEKDRSVNQEGKEAVREHHVTRQSTDEESAEEVPKDRKRGRPLGVQSKERKYYEWLLYLAILGYYTFRPNNSDDTSMTKVSSPEGQYQTFEFQLDIPGDMPEWRKRPTYEPDSAMEKVVIEAAANRAEKLVRALEAAVASGAIQAWVLDSVRRQIAQQQNSKRAATSPEGIKRERQNLTATARYLSPLIRIDPPVPGFRSQAPAAYFSGYPTNIQSRRNQRQLLPNQDLHISRNRAGEDDNDSNVPSPRRQLPALYAANRFIPTPSANPFLPPLPNNPWTPANPPQITTGQGLVPNTSVPLVEPPLSPDLVANESLDVEEMLDISY